jgi:plastocyanin
MSRRLLALAAVLALTVAVAGCGSSSSSSDSTSTPAPTPTTAAPAGGTDSSGGASAEAGATKIIMKDISFNPKATTVKVGDTIEWINQDDVQHNVVADSGATFKSDTFGKGGTFTYTANKAGTITYECTLHPGMTGTITVTS